MKNVADENGVPLEALNEGAPWPIRAVETLSRIYGLDEDEKLCIRKGFEQWEASLKRADMTERDRVGGALLAYARQAFAIRLRPDRYPPFHGDDLS